MMQIIQKTSEQNGILLPYPAEDANKYSRGKVVVCAGSAAYPGAALLSSRATQLVGAGYTEVFTHERNVALLQNARPSLVVRAFDELNAQVALPLNHPGAVLAGSGMASDDTAAAQLVTSVLAQVKQPVLLDGGALQFAARKEVRQLIVQRVRKGQLTVLTPHAGEAARLAKPCGFELEERLAGTAKGGAADDLRDAQVRDALRLSQAYGAIVVLKGPSTVVALPDDAPLGDGLHKGVPQEDELHGRAIVLDEGTAALAKAGTGDVLAGIIAGLLAQGMDACDACVLGVRIHAQAGIEASSSVGIISVCAEDVLNAIPHVLMKWPAE